MPFLTFPLRLREGGVLHRTEEADAIVRFLHVMAATPAGTWKGCPAFGLRDLLEATMQSAERCRLMVERTNGVFTDLGVLDYRIEEITQQGSVDGSSQEFSIVVCDVRRRKTVVTRVLEESGVGRVPGDAGRGGSMR